MRTTNQKAGLSIFLTIACTAVFLLTSIGEGYPQIRVNNIVMPEANIVKADPPPGQEAKIGMNILDVEVEFPLHAYENPRTGAFTELSNSFGFRNQTISKKFPADDDEYFPDALYAMNYSLALVKSLGKKWYTVAFGSAGLYTDFENVDGNHLLIEGGAFFVRKLSKSFHFGLGPVFTYAFGEPIIIPAPFLRYAGQGRVSAEIKFPRYAKLNYAVSQGFQVGLAARSFYNNYSLGHTEAQSNGENTVILFSDLALGIESSIRLFKPLFLNVGVGTTIDREFVVDDNNGDQLFDRGMKDTIFFTFGLATEF